MFNSKKKNRPFLTACSVNTFLTACAVNTLLAALATPAIANEANMLEETIVTARKKQMDLQDAPIAISVMSGEDFKRANLQRLDDFNGYVPGLTIAKNDGAGRVVSIRGVGWETAQNLSTQPSVLVYIDGIYVANPLAIGTDIGDIERVEVFRGPQGTEFGQGTTGGAINLVMKKPSADAVSGEFELSLGTFDAVTAHGAVNVPLGDNVAVRGSIQKYQRDGFAEIKGGTLDGYELDDADSITSKLSLLWEPSDNLSVLLSAFMSDSETNAAAQKNVDDPISDARKLSQDFPGTFDLQNNLYSSTVKWHTDSGVTLTWLGGYQDLKKEQTVDGDRLTEELTSINITGWQEYNWDVLSYWDNDSTSLTQELNATYSGDNVDWVVGAYYLDHENYNHFLEASGPSPFSDSIEALRNPSEETLPPFESVLNFVEERTVTRKDTAVYGNLTYRINDMFAVTGGIRYQDEEQTDESVQFFSSASKQETDDSAVTWKVGLDINFSEDNLLYGLVSTGWKNGGTNPGALSGALQVPIEFSAAEVTSYEIGSKNTLAEGRGRLNVVAFFNQYDDLQFMQEDPVPFAGGTGNIPKSEIYGIESEFNWMLTDEWQVSGHLTWLDGEFTEDFYALDTVDFREALVPYHIGLFTDEGFNVRKELGETTNLKGNTPPKLVDLSARIGLTNTHTFSNGGVLTSQLDYVYRGEYQYRVFNNPLVDDVPSYEIVNLFFDYQPADSNLRYSLTASNLFDEDGVNSRFSNPFGMWSTSEEYVPPRQVMATVKYSF
jgi:iron complex outermembrane recepter protein